MGVRFFEVWVPVLFSGHVFELFDQLAVPKWLCYYLWDIFVYTNKYKHKYKRMNVYGYECLHMFACMYVRAYVCIYQYMYTRAHACAYTCAQICKDNQKRVYGIFFEGECFFSGVIPKETSNESSLFTLKGYRSLSSLLLSLLNKTAIHKEMLKNIIENFGHFNNMWIYIQIRLSSLHYLCLPLCFSALYYNVSLIYVMVIILP